MANPHSAYPEADCGDVDEWEEVVIASVIAGCEMAAVLELVEAAFDAVAQPVDRLVMGDSSAARIRFNLDTVEEIGREPIPYLNGNRWHMGFSKDAEHAVITCFGTEPCSHDGWGRAVISTDDNTSVQPLESQAIGNDPLRFPGEPQPSVALTEAARFAANGQCIVFVDADGDVLPQNADGQPITMLFDYSRLRSGFAFFNATSALPSNTRGRSRVTESDSLGSVRGRSEMGVLPGTTNFNRGCSQSFRNDDALSMPLTGREFPTNVYL